MKLILKARFPSQTSPNPVRGVTNNVCAKRSIDINKNRLRVIPKIMKWKETMTPRRCISTIEVEMEEEILTRGMTERDTFCYKKPSKRWSQRDSNKNIWKGHRKPMRSNKRINWMKKSRIGTTNKNWSAHHTEDASIISNTSAFPIPQWWRYTERPKKRRTKRFEEIHRKHWS